MDDLEEKFTRCPKCRSYSIASTPPKIYNSFFSFFVKKYNHYHCRNCGHNFKQLQNEETRFFARPRSVSGRKPLRGLLLSAAGILLVLAIILLLHPEEKQTPSPENQTEAMPAAITEGNSLPKTEPAPANNREKSRFDEKETPLEETGISAASVSSAPASETGVIDLAGENRFGVNWRKGKTGLVITRLGEGPLLNAGLTVGDTITHLNETAIESDSTLMNFKEQLFLGTAKEGTLTVLHNEQIKKYKMLNSGYTEKKRADRESILLFPASQLKIRSSSPDLESVNHRWVYLKKSITITRQANQRFYLSGEAAGLSPWAADNILSISNNDIPGLGVPITPETSVINREHCRDPIEITDYFPAQETVEIRFSLVDLGIKWGNTDIYLVIR